MMVNGLPYKLTNNQKQSADFLFSIFILGIFGAMPVEEYDREH